MTPHHQRPGRKSEQGRIRAGESLGEQRYQELMRGLSDLFQEAEQEAPLPTGTQRVVVIKEINALLTRHGLTVEDLGEI